MPRHIRPLNADGSCPSSYARVGNQCVLKAVTEKQRIVQTLIFSKDVFRNRKDAVKWAKDNNFKSSKVDENDSSFRLRQREPGEFDSKTFRTISLTDGVQAVVGELKKSKSEEKTTKSKDSFWGSIFN